MGLGAVSGTAWEGLIWGDPAIGDYVAIRVKLALNSRFANLETRRRPLPEISMGKLAVGGSPWSRAAAGREIAVLER